MFRFSIGEYLPLKIFFALCIHLQRVNCILPPDEANLRENATYKSGSILQHIAVVNSPQQDAQSGNQTENRGGEISHEEFVFLKIGSINIYQPEHKETSPSITNTTSQQVSEAKIEDLKLRIAELEKLQTKIGEIETAERATTEEFLLINLKISELKDRNSALELKLEQLEELNSAFEKIFTELQNTVRKSTTAKSEIAILTESFQDSKLEIAKSPYSNKLYIFSTNQKLPFSSAKVYCEDRNTTLASIHSKGEYDFVEEWLSTHFKTYSHVWLGHQRPTSSAAGSSNNGWHDGTTIDYALWGPVDNGGKPNPSGCMFMCHYCGAHINGFYIRPCQNLQYFLCQKIL